MKRVHAGRPLRNGLRYYTMKDSSVHLVGIGVGVGSMYDPPGMSGMAHLTEHVVSRTTIPGVCERDLELWLTEYGCGKSEICTGRESTFYGVGSLARRAHALELFPHFAEMVKSRIVNPKVLDTELAAVYCEHLSLFEDSVFDLMEVGMHKLMYDRNPARKRVDCESDDLKKRITPAAMEDFIRTWYVPNNMFVIILGPSHKDAQAMVKKHFGDLEPSPSLVRPTTDEILPILTAIKGAEIRRGTRMIYPGGKVEDLKLWSLGIGFPTMPYGSEDDEAIDVLAQILQFRSYDLLRWQNHTIGNGAYSPTVEVSRSFLHGLFYLCFTTPSEEFMKVGEDRFLRECEKIKRWGVDYAEIERSVADLEGQKRAATEAKLKREHRRMFSRDFTTMRNAERNLHTSAFQFDPGTLSSMILEAVANGDENLRDFNDYRRRLSEVTRSRVVAAANKYLTTPDRYARLVIRPFDE